jgi:hypothetical protein
MLAGQTSSANQDLAMLATRGGDLLTIGCSQVASPDFGRQKPRRGAHPLSGAEARRPRYGIRSGHFDRRQATKEGGTNAVIPDPVQLHAGNLGEAHQDMNLRALSTKATAALRSRIPIKNQR